jgi:hypothetical protein
MIQTIKKLSIFKFLSKFYSIFTLSYRKRLFISAALITYDN